jgi:hypothetical protein
MSTIRNTQEEMTQIQTYCDFREESRNFVAPRAPPGVRAKGSLQSGAISYEFARLLPVFVWNRSESVLQRLDSQSVTSTFLA